MRQDSYSWSPWQSHVGIRTRHTEQFMGNENKTGLNELTERSSTTDADHYLHSSTTMGKYDCKSNVFAWEKYFLLNGTESRVAGGVIDAPIFKRESGATLPLCSTIKTAEHHSNSPAGVRPQRGRQKFRKATKMRWCSSGWNGSCGVQRACL